MADKDHPEDLDDSVLTGIVGGAGVAAAVKHEDWSQQHVDPGIAPLSHVATEPGGQAHGPAVVAEPGQSHTGVHSGAVAAPTFIEGGHGVGTGVSFGGVSHGPVVPTHGTIEPVSHPAPTALHPTTGEPHPPTGIGAAIPHHTAPEPGSHPAPVPTTGFHVPTTEPGMSHGPVVTHGPLHTTMSPGGEHAPELEHGPAKLPIHETSLPVHPVHATPTHEPIGKLPEHEGVKPLHDPFGKIAEHEGHKPAHETGAKGHEHEGHKPAHEAGAKGHEHEGHKPAHETGTKGHEHEGHKPAHETGAKAHEHEHHKEPKGEHGHLGEKAHAIGETITAGLHKVEGEVKGAWDKITNKP